jgi:major type 1 subunit fimbrin (pilin)
MNRRIKQRSAGPCFLLAILLLLSTSRVFASSCTGGLQAFTLSLPATVSVPRDMAVGSLLTSWIYSASSTGLYSCRGTNDAIGGRGAVAYFTSATASSVNAPSGGSSVTVYQTNVPGVGIAVAGSIYNGYAGWSSWNGFTTSYGGPIWTPLNGTYSVGAQVAVALVKTGNITGGVIPGVVVLNFAPYTSAGTQTNQLDTYAITPVTIVSLACTTPNVTVPLGTHSPSEMASVGATAAAVSFDVSLNNCPAGLNSVKYRIDPVTTVVNSAQSIVALDGSSSASGVAVQLLNSAGTAAFPLSSLQTFSSYSKSTGGSYTIPLKARYYRTGTITPGTANTSMTFTMQYL